jgi:hypothetical protein
VSRLLAVVLALTGLALVATPDAHATTRRSVVLTIHLSDPKIAEGESVTIHGKARHADPRTRVVLQRRSAGAWRQVGKRHRLLVTQAYSFSLTPSRGLSRYRVVTLERPDQPVARSTAVGILVTWQPTVDIAAVPVTHDDGSRWLELTGHVRDGTYGQVVDLEYGLEGEWWQVDQTFHPTGSQAFSAEVSREGGYDFRFVVRPSAFTTEAVSAMVTSSDPPFVVPLNSALDFTFHHDAVVTIPVSAGDEVTLDGTWWTGSGGSWSAAVTQPSGASAGTLGNGNGCGCGVVKLVADQDGEVRLSFGTEGTMAVHLIVTTPKIVGMSVDGDAKLVEGDLAGQEVEVKFDVTAGQPFTLSGLYDVNEPTEIRASDGTAPHTWVAPDQMGGVYLFNPPKDDTWTLRLSPRFGGFVPDHRIELLSVQTETATVDAPETSTTFDRTGRFALFRVDLADGDAITYGGAGASVKFYTFDAATGHPPPAWPVTGQVMVLATGGAGMTASVAADSPVETEVSVDGAPTAYSPNGQRGRYYDLVFHGSAGQMVEPGMTGDDYDLVGVIGPDGSRAKVLFASPEIYLLPADGTYRMRFLARGNGGQGGTAVVESVPQVPLPQDGTATTLTMPGPDRYVVGKITAPVGTDLDLTLSDVSASLGNDWYVFVDRPDAAVYDIWSTSPKLPWANHEPDTSSLEVYVVPNVYVILGAFNGSTGSVNLTVTPSA